MNSEKVKEIKKALEQQGNCGIVYAVNNNKKKPCKFINYTDILTLINELESENERLKREKQTLEDEDTLLVKLGEIVQENQQLKDRNVELNKKNIEFLNENGGLQKSYCSAIDKIGELSAERYIKVVQFASMLKDTIKNFCGTLYENAYYKVTKKFACDNVDVTLNKFINKGE